MARQSRWWDCRLGRLAATQNISDGAGQFAIGLHALCWIHAERLIHKLIPINDAQRQAVALVRGQLWGLYADLKAYKRQPEPDEVAPLPAYVVANTSLVHAGNAYRITAGIKNLFNKAYYAGAVNANLVSPAELRSLALGITFFYSHLGGAIKCE